MNARTAIPDDGTEGARLIVPADTKTVLVAGVEVPVHAYQRKVATVLIPVSIVGAPTDASTRAVRRWFTEFLEKERPGTKWFVTAPEDGEAHLHNAARTLERILNTKTGA